MFINPNILKKLMKEAFKNSGLRIGKRGETIYIAGSYWDMEIAEEFLEKEILVQLVALTGEVPIDGEFSKNHSYGKQICVFPKSFMNLEAYDTELEVTDVVVVNKIYQRVLRDTALKKAYAMDDKFINMINNKYVDEKNGEKPVQINPMYNTKSPGSGVIWKNNVCSFRAILLMDDKHIGLFRELGNIELIRDE